MNCKKCEEYDCKKRAFEGYENEFFCEVGLKKFLAEASPYLGPIFTAVADVLIRIDEKGKYLDIISKSEEKIISSKENVLGKNIDQFLPKEIATRAKKIIKKVIRKRGVEVIEYELSVPAGVLWFEATISWLRASEAMVIIRDITKRKEAEQKIYYLTYHDKLTGLYNRSYFEEILEKIDKVENLPVSVIVADVNGLKLVNDTYGHFTGDKMLKICSDVLRENCRNSDIICRWGGDEFLIFLPKTTKEDASRVCERIASANAYVENIPIGISLGLSTKEKKKEKIASVLKKAENKMYDNKLCGRDKTKTSVIEALLTVLGEKSHESREHVYRMQRLAKKIGERVGLPATEIERLDSAILLHDIGKINISQEILKKKSALSQKEMSLIRKHPEFGHRIASSIDKFGYVASDIFCHHERWDGKGYPRGIQKEKIPLLARIISVVDAYDAMKSGRCYQEAKDEQEIIEELRSLSGKQFDPNLVNVFLKILKEEKKEIVKNY